MAAKPPSSYVRLMIKRIEEAGGSVEPGRKGGHWKVYYEGRYIGPLPCTPGDRRSELNDVAQLRRNGLPIARKKTPSKPCRNPVE